MEETELKANTFFESSVWHVCSATSLRHIPQRGPSCGMNNTLSWSLVTAGGKKSRESLWSSQHVCVRLANSSVPVGGFRANSSWTVVRVPILAMGVPVLFFAALHLVTTAPSQYTMLTRHCCVPLSALCPLRKKRAPDTCE